MTDLSAIWSTLAPQVTGFLGGETITLARPSSLSSLDPDGAVGALTVVSDAAAGDSAVEVELPDHGKMAGSLLAGARLVIGGETYAVAADAPGVAGTFTSFVATLGRPLVADVAGGAAVTVHPEALFTFAACQISYRKRHDLARHLQETYVATVTVSSKGAPTQPRINDMVTLPDGTVGRVSGGDVGNGAFWKLIVGA